MRSITYWVNKWAIYFVVLLIPFIIILFSKGIYAQSPRIFINEFLASNLSSNPDMVDFDDFSDWIELYNDENTDVNIGGFYITDDLTIIQSIFKIE